MSQEYALRLEHIRKEYPGTVALKDMDLELKKGEILAIAGENGAGKTTLIKTCSGAVIPTSGKIFVGGREYSRMTPKMAIQNGISVIYQEINNVPELSVAENMFLGHPVRKGIFVDKKAMEEKAAEELRKLNVSIDVKTPIKNLSVAHQQMVEIAKAVQMKADILIMDEPSALLSDAEVDNMFKVIRTLWDGGISVIYISHRLDELFRISDRIMVIRDGEFVTTLTTAQSNKDELIRYMVGRELKEKFPVRGKCIREEKILEIKNLSGNGDSGIDFDVHRGEIVGMGGLVGAGRSELAEMIFGTARAESGKMYFKGREIAPGNPQEAIDIGIALLTEDRVNLGTIGRRSVKENINIPVYKKISKFGVVDTKAEYETAEEYRNRLSIKTPAVEDYMMSLSGGNQQKVILARWLAADADLIIFDEPTVGIDVGAKYEIYRLMNELVEEGKSVLMISSDMEELLSMSDRIVVMSEGKQTGILEKEDFSQENVMKLATIVS